MDHLLEDAVVGGGHLDPAQRRKVVTELKNMSEGGEAYRGVAKTLD